MNYLTDVDMAIINGGGSHNKFILKTIEEITNLKIMTGEEFGIDSDGKEALAFVVLGYQTLINKPSNVKSVTGAKDFVILGNITNNPLVYKNE
jgi:anhydro-N-acetylmuramic acid kinase